MSADTDERDDLELAEELFEFLQGRAPEGYRIRRGHMPKLTANQAWTVIWYLGNQFWQVPDTIERCDVCGNIHDSESEGECLDYGKGPYQFCDNCLYSEEYERKKKREPK